MLFAGCADNDAGSGFSATQGTDGTSGTDGAASTSSTSSGAVDSTTSTSGALPTTGMTSAVTASDDSSTSTGMGVESSSGAPDTGEPGGTSTSGTTGEVGTTAATTGEETAGALGFLVDIWPIFDDHCSCHEDANGAGKLILTMEDAYMNMIDVPSDQVPEMMLIKKGGTAEESYLWHKLNNTQDDVGGKGKKMPPGGKLKMADLDLIKQWLDEGANP